MRDFRYVQNDTRHLEYQQCYDFLYIELLVIKVAKIIFFEESGIQNKGRVAAYFTVCCHSLVKVWGLINKRFYTIVKVEFLEERFTHSSYLFPKNEGKGRG